MKNKRLGTGIQGFSPITKVTVALRGIYLAVLTDFSVAYKLFLSIFLLAGFFYFRQWLDFSIVLIATALVLVTEMMNTAIETLCDFVEPELNEKIGLIKDVSAGAVGVAIGVWFVVITIEVYRAYLLLN